MELKEFVTTTLVQITEGVKDAQEQLKDSGVLINPRSAATVNAVSDTDTRNLRMIQSVKMDIAITVSENVKGKAGIGIAASVFKVGASNEEGSSNSHTSRIEFDIPISFPVMSDKES